MSEENSVLKEQPRKKKRSLWWIWFLLILAAFAGGTVMGLKLNTLPLPNEVRDRLYPILESYIPGSTAQRTTAAAVTPAPEATLAPEATPAPEVTPAPVEESVPETPAPEASAAPAMPAVLSAAETAAPAETAASAETASSAETAETPERSVPTAQFIGVNAALEITLTHADVDEQDAEITGVVRTKDEEGKAIYKVGFKVGEIEYEYIIDAVSGEVDSWTMSGMTFSEDAAFGAVFEGNTLTETEAAQTVEKLIDEDQARDIAFQHAKVKAAEAVSTTAELKQEAETAYYHLEFRTATKNFSYDVDAHSGEVLGFERSDR